MGGIVTFNGGTAPGWTLPQSTVVPGAGPDGSHALVVNPSFPRSSQTQPISPCAQSRRLTVTWWWRRDYHTAGTGATLFELWSTELAGNAPWQSGNPFLMYMTFGSVMTEGNNDDGQVSANAPGDGDGFNLWGINNGPATSDPPWYGQTAALDDIFPEVGSGWLKARFDILLSSGFDGSGNVLKDGYFKWYWGTDENNLILRYSLVNVGIVNPTLLPVSSGSTATSLPYDTIVWHIHGSIDDVEWDDHCDEPASGLQENQYPLQCCDEPSASGGPGGGGNVGTNPDPVGIFPPFEASCTGGGQVEEVSDLAGLEAGWSL